LFNNTPIGSELRKNYNSDSDNKNKNAYTARALMKSFTQKLLIKVLFISNK